MSEKTQYTEMVNDDSKNIVLIFNFHQIIVIKIQKVLYKYRIAVFIHINTVT